jgi:hypothetical protein
VHEVALRPATDPCLFSKDRAEFGIGGLARKLETLIPSEFLVKYWLGGILDFTVAIFHMPGRSSYGGGSFLFCTEWFCPGFS